MRKPLKRNAELQLVNSDKIAKRADEVLNSFYDEFPDIDCNDLLHILISKGHYIALMKNIKDNKQ